ncbi:uncharacterized protein ACHE_30089S [Aspergillus chevalieri]|uniref:Uncharacterized protein n=1 Tax=Aspergillus chevalieri TaxID=182096 RepID=A0A7R7ZME8_ASPCH|nr:uncharacterized protein ACHE_30089S [Aspergillus chevalieri]BCR86102.1 hypothetical protein ACHE_30089S [Aspergillus chevalieri]
MAYRSLTLLSLLFPSTLAQDSDLVGCKAVSCPIEGTEDHCTVAEDIFLGSGTLLSQTFPQRLRVYHLSRASISPFEKERPLKTPVSLNQSTTSAPRQI